VGISVYTEFPVMSEPPETDILLLRKEGEFKPAQAERLPDGIRESKADHILIEFKYSESVNEDAFRQTLGYDTFYRRSQRLAEDKVQTFLVSAKTPAKAVLKRFGYSGTERKGVYQSSNPLLRRTGLVSLNELSDELHNAFFKCFASRIKEKESAFDLLRHTGAGLLHIRLHWIIQGLRYIWFGMKGDDMKTELTPEKISEIGKMWTDAILAGMTPEERLAGLKPEERLAGLKAEERLAGLKAEERLAGLKAEERLAGLKPEEIEAYLCKLRKKKPQRKKD